VQLTPGPIDISLLGARAPLSASAAIDPASDTVIAGVGYGALVGAMPAATRTDRSAAHQAPP
jgi:hypothetical protein